MDSLHKILTTAINSNVKDWFGCYSYSDAFNKPQWGTINSDKVTEKERAVVCRQLGYDHSSGESGLPTRGPEDSRVWLTHVKCHDDQQLNILDCGGELCGSQMGCDEHEYDLVIKCGEFAIE